MAFDQGLRMGPCRDLTSKLTSKPVRRSTSDSIHSVDGRGITYIPRDMQVNEDIAEEAIDCN